MNRVFCPIVVFCILGSCGLAKAGIVGQGITPLATYGFSSISNNKLADAQIGATQLFVDLYGWDDGEAVGDPGVASALFLFRNVGPEPSSITAVYFQDGALLSLSEVINGEYVKFSKGATPPNLPGGSGLDPSFEPTSGFLADSDPPVERNGVHPGQELGVVFSLVSDLSVSDVIGALELALSDPSKISEPDDLTLRIGIQVQGFAGGGSEQFINSDGGGTSPAPPVVPEPGAFLLWTVGGILSGLMIRRRRLNVTV